MESGGLLEETNAAPVGTSNFRNERWKVYQMRLYLLMERSYLGWERLDTGLASNKVTVNQKEFVLSAGQRFCWSGRTSGGIDCAKGLPRVTSFLRNQSRVARISREPGGKGTKNNGPKAKNNRRQRSKPKTSSHMQLL